MISVVDFNATGNGDVDDTTALQTAINEGHALGQPVLIPSGVYRITRSLEIPVESNPNDLQRNSHFSLIGEHSHTIYRAYGPPPSPPPPPPPAGPTQFLQYPRMGSVIFADGTFTAIRTRAITGTNPPAFGAELSPQWSNYVAIRDVYVVGNAPSEYLGPNGEVLDPAALRDDFESVGFDLTGIFFGRFHNLHAEGFGAGLRVRNGSELFFTGETDVRNCRIGALLQRMPPDGAGQEYDMQVWFDYLVTVSNGTNLVIDRARSVWINGGENIVPEPVAARRRIEIRNGDNTQVHIRNYVLEVHRHVTGRTPAGEPQLAADDTVLPPIYVDANGLSLLSVEGLNWETSPPVPLIECDGWFDRIEVRNSALPRALLLPAGNRQPLVHLRSPGAAGGSYDNDQSRSMQVVLEGNSPAVADTWVRDESRGSATVRYRDPLHDYVPAGFEQINPRPQMDQANDNRIRVSGGPYGFTNADPLAGRGRLFWAQVRDDTAVTFTPSRPLSGVRTLYITLIAYVPPASSAGNALDDNWIPEVKALDGLGDAQSVVLGAGTLRWTQQRVELERYDVGQMKFTKFAITVTVVRPDAVLRSITLGPFLGGTNQYGLETLNVYADRRHTGTVDPGQRMRHSPPSAATDGAHAPGDMVYNASPGWLEPVGWVCIAPGVPGTWRPFGHV